MGMLSKISRYYFFYGPDEYSKLKRINSLVSNVIEPSLREFDYSVFQGRGLDAATMVNVALSPPFGSPLRVVLLRDIDKVSPKGLDLIQRFIGSIPDHTTLVITGPKPDRRKKIYKTLLSVKKNCVGFYEPRPVEAVRHAVEYARGAGVLLDPQAAACLVESVGCDSGRLERELDKLSLFVGEHNAIRKEDVQNVSGVGILGTVEDLPRKIGDGQVIEAFSLLHNLRLLKNETTILAVIKDYFLDLNMLKLPGAKPGDLTGRRFGYLDLKAESLARQSKKFSAACIVDCLHCIYETEIGLKSAVVPHDIVLLDLVSRLTALVKRE